MPRSSIEFIPDSIAGQRNQERDCLPILRDFFCKQISIPEAEARLEAKGAVGQMFAGEVCLEQSTRSTPNGAKRWLEAAAVHYTICAEPVSLQSGIRQSIPEEEFSQLRLAQLSLYGELLIAGTLPTNDVAEATYQRVVACGSRLGKLLENTKDSVVGHRLVGIAAETSVLALAQRFAIRSEISQEWFPLSSSPSQDNLRLTGDKSGQWPWDITIWTASNTTLDQTYKIQVKTKKDPSKAVYNIDQDHGVVTIYVNPDLRLSNRDWNLHRTILDDCAAELQSQDAHELYSIARRLDARTEQLLQIID